MKEYKVGFTLRGIEFSSDPLGEYEADAVVDALEAKGIICFKLTKISPDWDV